MILHRMDQQTCSNWTCASLLLHFWTAALFCAAEQLRWSIQTSNKQLGVTCWRLGCSSCVLLPEDSKRQLWPSFSLQRWKLHPSLVIFTLFGGLTCTQPRNLATTNKSVHTFTSFFPPLIWVDYIHKSCFHFSGGKMFNILILLCCYIADSLYLHPGNQNTISFLLQPLGGRGKKKIHRGGPI